MRRALLVLPRRPDWAARAGRDGPGGATRLIARARQSWAGVIGGVLLILICAVVLVGPLLWDRSPTDQSLIDAFQGPSASHPLGTDHLGRDTLARFMAGGRVDLAMSGSSGILSVAIGTLVGVIAATFRGLETLLMRFVDSLLALPGIVQAIILVAVIGRGIAPLVIALAVYAIPIFARVAYSSTQQVMGEDYYSAAVVVGASPLAIICRHILPNLLTPILVLGSLQIAANINIAAALNFFGLGVQPPTPVWGRMIDEAKHYSYEHPLMLAVPGIGLFLAGMAFNLLGDGLRDWLDPKHAIGKSKR